MGFSKNSGARFNKSQTGSSVPKLKSFSLGLQIVEYTLEMYFYLMQRNDGSFCSE